MGLRKTEYDQYVEGVAGHAMRGWRDLEDFITRIPEKVKKQVLADEEVKEVINAMRAVGRLVAHENMEVPDDEE